MHRRKKPAPELHVVEEYPGSFQYDPAANGQPPMISGIVRSCSGTVPDGVIGCLLMFHLPGCGLRYDEDACDCMEFDEDGETTGRRLEPRQREGQPRLPHPIHDPKGAHP